MDGALVPLPHLPIHPIPQLVDGMVHGTHQMTDAAVEASVQSKLQSWAADEQMVTASLFWKLFGVHPTDDDGHVAPIRRAHLRMYAHPVSGPET